MEDNGIKFENWVTVRANNIKIENGPYLVTIINQLDIRKVEYATYNDGVWTINDSEQHKNWEVIAYIPNLPMNVIPYDKSIQKFKRGDIIVWDDKYGNHNWMIIDSFDYPSDRAARAAIGKLFVDEFTNVIYTSWVPSYYSDFARFATEEEIDTICLELRDHYRLEHNRRILELELKNPRKDIYERVINLLEE